MNSWITYFAFAGYCGAIDVIARASCSENIFAKAIPPRPPPVRQRKSRRLSRGAAFTRSWRLVDEHEFVRVKEDPAQIGQPVFFDKTFVTRQFVRPGVAV